MARLPPSRGISSLLGWPGSRLVHQRRSGALYRRGSSHSPRYSRKNTRWGDGTRSFGARSRSGVGGSCMRRHDVRHQIHTRATLSEDRVYVYNGPACLWAPPVWVCSMPRRGGTGHGAGAESSAPPFPSLARALALAGWGRGEVLPEAEEEGEGPPGPANEDTHSPCP